jgi:ubiquinone/menaquinone biosynthesis C-methylase UbiE
MHHSVMEWVAEKTRQHDFTGQSVLEVGSMNVNGSVRELFATAASYTGVDFMAGAGVDVVMNAHELAFPDASFDLVLSTEMLEHDDEFWLSVREMGRVLKPGGLLLLTARGNGFMPHDYPFDYWRFMPASFNKLLAMAGCEVLEVREDWQAGHPGVFGLGRRSQRKC